jgi:AcrR family transcriptional regulator
MGVKFDKTARADQVRDAALELFLERPRDEVTFEQIAERAGLNFWQVYHFHSDARLLFRAAVSRLLQRIEDDLDAMPCDAASVSEAVRTYATYVAAVMQRESYAQFLYLFIRDRCFEPMLEEGYEARVAKVIREGLARIVGNAGLHHDLTISMSAASTRAFVSSLEVELVLPKLLPGFEPPPADAVAATIRRVADQALAATYALDSQAA